MIYITCSACDAEYTLTFDEHQTEGEITYCCFCGEKLYLKDAVQKPWYEEDEE